MWCIISLYKVYLVVLKKQTNVIEFLHQVKVRRASCFSSHLVFRVKHTTKCLLRSWSRCCTERTTCKKILALAFQPKVCWQTSVRVVLGFHK